MSQGSEQYVNTRGLRPSPTPHEDSVSNLSHYTNAEAESVRRTPENDREIEERRIAEEAEDEGTKELSNNFRGFDEGEAYDEAEHHERNRNANGNGHWGGELSKSPGGRYRGSFLTWNNINYSVKVKIPKEKKDKENKVAHFFRSRFSRKKKEKKMILQNVTGYVKPGMMIALMGSSGSGKSTLLDILSDRKTTGKTEGEILTNGHKRNKYFRRNVGYVEQFDILLGTLTPRELFTYCALLRLDSSISKEDKKQRVEEVIRDLGLSDCADTLIGGVGRRGISGGQAKRVNIGLELVTNPPILFLDEPTSGLDSATSYEVVSIIRSIADSGRAVICTIHQPGADLFNLFDRLLLLINGQVGYFGKASESVNYFESLGYKIPPQLNPAVSGNQEKQEAIGIKGPGLSEEELIDKYKESDMPKIIQREVERINQMEDDDLQSFSDPFTENQKEYAAGPTYIRWFYSLWVLTRRNFKSSLRDKSFVGTRLFRNIAFAILTATFFWGLDMDQDGLFNRVASLFYIVTFAGFGAIVFLAKRRPLLNRERNSATYRSSTYYFALNILEFPFIVISAIILSLIVYWTIGYKAEAEAFFFFVYIIFATLWTAATFAIMVAAISPNYEVATAVLPIVLSIFLTLSGFFVRDIPSYWIWASYLSFWRYSFQSLAINELEGQTFTCAEDTTGCIPTGDQQLEILEFDDVNKWISSVYLWMFGVAFLIIGFFFTRFIHWEKK